ncbi:enoyl-CoA hydratase/isomerase family protein [Geminicoccaceae bacterium 1502E]|nr:enoyl-CoA hydratase/isomerase family protein [Geminicoccaceae bacterium 1502E]
MSEAVSVADHGARREVTLTRPARGNALADETVGALTAALTEAERDGVRLLVLRGEGRNFCTGFDLSDLAETDDAALLARFVRIEMLLARVWTAPFQTLALAQGRVFGAGADLFAACGRRMAIEGARFSFPGAAFGLVLGSRRLAVRTGPEAAMELIASGREIDAERARSLGLVSRVIGEDEVEAMLEEETACAGRLDSATAAGIRGALAEHTGLVDADLANLVRSAVRPGLKDRITAYRERARAAAASRAEGRARAAD